MPSLNGIMPPRAGPILAPVLLVVEGHFTLEANPDTGEMMKTLMTDQAGKFIPGKDCSH
ncbi:copper homeostasis protein CutF precursor / Lipoprotein NlpE [Klebsiella pneumoniae]|uniref:Copper homeostasis protein CutF / Lipoprotein NlpE n=1 Tax=Klebsiella pneumoniae TaxID=573 RepID=A0A2X3EV09_KLEPN|nr:copper homeostasis protein CutF precursor / Lipoprotein NlpE [Klebsiella pneumoniae]